jgi:acyl-CoA synthetase (AMP-forming)/AMP-acid ligase II
MYSTLLEALEASACTELGIHFVESAERQHFLAYRELYRDALGVLAGLQKRGVRAGDEMVLQYADLKGFVTAYWACLAGGIVPVPLEHADKPANAEKVFTVWRVLRDAWLATDCPKLAGKLDKFASEAGHEAQWARMRGRILFPQHERADPQTARIAAVSPGHIAFIQFSSGSTGAPKGVALTHANLLTNIGDLLASIQHGAHDCFLSWKPITHDFGMIAFHLAPIVSGSAQVRIATEAFIWNPSLWLTMATRFRATILGSPTFGYRHLLKLYRRNPSRRHDWDLSCVRVIINGAESISAQLCEEFSREFAGYGLPADAMRCGYGLAEGSLVVSLCPPGEPVRSVAVDRLTLGIGDRLREIDPAAPGATSLVDCGFPCPRTQVRITGAQRMPLPDGHVGRIEIRGAAVTAGYYRNADASAELIAPDGWLDTQDLGALRGGRLLVVGRVKDMIRCADVNYFPHDIEQAILRAKGESELNKFIACGVYNPKRGSEEPLVFVHHKAGGGDFAALGREVRRLVLDAFGLVVAHVVPVRKIPKTTSGKVQRFRLVRDFLAGKFDAALHELGEARSIGALEVADVFACPTVAAPRQRLQACLAEHAGAAAAIAFPDELFRIAEHPAATHSVHANRDTESAAATAVRRAA